MKENFRRLVWVGLLIGGLCVVIFLGPGFSFERADRLVCVEKVLSQPSTQAGNDGPIETEGRIETTDGFIYATQVELEVGECYQATVIVMGSRPSPDIVESVTSS